MIISYCSQINLVLTEYNIREILFEEEVYMKRHVNKFLMIKLILCAELIIYCSFIYLDFTTKYKSVFSTSLKYTGILLCLIMTLLIGNDGHDEKDTELLQIALSFTALADLCMVILDYNVLGIFLFCFVQATYIVRHSRALKKKCRFFTIIVSSILIASIVKVGISKIDVTSSGYSSMHENLIIIGSMYFFLLCYSLFTAWRTLNGSIYPKYSSFLISIGMTLFFLCDINVGISGVMANVIISGYKIDEISRFSIWIFYLPSQVLISLSGYIR